MNTAQPHKILMTTDTLGGAWTYSIELIRALKNYNIIFYLASMGDLLSPAQRKQIEEMDNVELFESKYKLEWMENSWDDKNISGHWLLDIEKRVRPDIIHLNGYAHAVFPFNAPKLVVAHSCVFSWFRDVYNIYPDDCWNRYRIEVSNGLQSADIVTAPSFYMLSVLNKFYGSFNAVEPIYNSVNAFEFLPANKEPFILSAGRVWDEAKNITALMEISDKLNFPVYIAGENHHPVNNGKVSFSDGEKSTGDIHWLGNISRKELAKYMSHASVFVMPALYEPFGLSILEAACAGCALVLSSIPSLKEIWKDSAVFIDPKNKSELTDGINNLICNESRLKLYSSKARKRAQMFTPEVMAEKYMAIYNKLFYNKEMVRFS